MDGVEGVRFNLFGGLEALGRSGVRIGFANRKVAQLAALLALKPGLSRDRNHVAGAVWPDAEPEAALASLRNALALLRKDLGSGGVEADDVLESDRTSLAFS